MPNPSRAPATADASKSPGTGRASPSGSRPYRVQNIFGFALIAIVPLSVGLVQGAGDGRLGDTDVYSWLNRVQNLRSSGAWFDETIVRVNPPVGHVQHWSRPFDLVLLIGGLIGEPFVGFRNAVVAWAVILPVLAGVITAWLLLRYFGDLLGRYGQFALFLFFAFGPFIINSFRAARADHQVLIFPLVVLMLGLARRALLSPDSPTRHVTWLGLVAALSLWVGLETVLAVGVTAAAIALWWVVHGATRWLAVLGRFMTVLAAAAAVAIVIENGFGGLSTVELDELSIVIVVLAALVAAACPLIQWLPPGWIASPGRRILTAGVLFAMIGVVLVLLFPALRTGPLGEVDPLYNEVRLQNIGEIQPLMTGTIGKSIVRLVGLFGILPLAGYAYFRARPQLQIEPAWLVLGLAAVVYSPLALWQVRWAPIAGMALLVPAAIGLQHAMIWTSNRALRMRTAPEALALFAGLFWVLVAIVAGLVAPAPQVESTNGECPLKPVVSSLIGQLGDEPRNLMASTDLGPELMWRTSHNVFSIPNHRPQPGFTTTHDFFGAADDQRAQAIATAAGIEAVLICANGPETAQFGDDDGDFYHRIVADQIPTWMRRLPLDSGDTDYRLFVIDT